MVVQVEEGGGDDGVLTTTQIRREPTQWRAAVYARLGTTSKMVSEIQRHEMQKFTELERRLRKMESFVKTLSPARPIHTVLTCRGIPIRVGSLAFEETDRRPILGRNPRTLSVLWDEWMNGVAGNLPAREFTRAQRGAKGVKANFCHRKPFWKCMNRLIDGGSTAAQALRRIDLVYEKYGSVTKQLKAIGKDEKIGGHRSLQIS